MVKYLFAHAEKQNKISYTLGAHKISLASRAVNPPGMGGRLPEFNSISRLPPDVAREMIISQNAPNFVFYNGSILKY